METIIAAVINGIFAVAVIIFGNMLNRKIKQVKDQVVNGHGAINMREESDDRHKENAYKLDTIITDVSRLRNSVERLWIKADKQTDQIHNLEITQDRRKQ